MARTGGKRAIAVGNDVAVNEERPQRRSAIIDIGSNSIRLVVFAGPARAPRQIFNEKLMIGLGSALSTTGALDPIAFKRGIKALSRFQLLANTMPLDELRCVATAAVRDATNGEAFIAAAKDVGVSIELLSGREEARGAGLGVISAIPDADGIVADLGGGSLELVRVAGGTTRHHSSFPWGVLRLAALRRSTKRKFADTVAEMLAEAGWPGKDRGVPLYLVGGSWRALARYDMLLSRDPMPVVSGHVMPIESAKRLSRRLHGADTTEIARLEGLTSARADTLPDAAALLDALVDALGTSRLVVSSSGLREGLLYEMLDEETRNEDPLLVTAEAEGKRFARFDHHGGLIADWIAPIFADDLPADARLRTASCHLSDIASTANPDFRAERAVEMALHGHWLGIDLSDRLVLAQALLSSSGGSHSLPLPARALVGLETRLARAAQWGQAIRLAQRLSAGSAHPLQQSRIAITGGKLVLTLAKGAAALDGEMVAKRMRQLADSFGLPWKITAA